MERGNEGEGREGERKKLGKRNHDPFTRIAPTLVGMRACAVPRAARKFGRPGPPPFPRRPAPRAPPAAHLLQSPRAPPRSHPEARAPVSPYPAYPPFPCRPAPRAPSAAHLLQSPCAPPKQLSARHKAPRKAGEVIRRTREDPAGSPRLSLPRAQGRVRRQALRFPEKGTDVAKLTVRRAGGRRAGRLTPAHRRAPLRRPGGPGARIPATQWTRTPPTDHPEPRGPAASPGPPGAHGHRSASTATLATPRSPLPEPLPAHFRPDAPTPRPARATPPFRPRPRPETRPQAQPRPGPPTPRPWPGPRPWATGGRRAAEKPRRSPTPRPFWRTRLAQRARPAPGLSVFALGSLTALRFRASSCLPSAQTREVDLKARETGLSGPSS